MGLILNAVHGVCRLRSCPSLRCAIGVLNMDMQHKSGKKWLCGEATGSCSEFACCRADYRMMRRRWLHRKGDRANFPV